MGLDMQSLTQDFRYAVRQLRSAPVFTLAAVLTLAIGIGANTAIFSLLYQTLLRSLPVKDPSRLVQLRFAGDNPGHTHSEGGDTKEAQAYFSYPMYRDLRDRASSFSGLIALSTATVGFSWNNRSELLPAELISGNYFSVLGVHSTIGRLLSSSDDNMKDGNPVAVLSYDYWTSHLGADGNILNKTVTLNGHPFTIVGVLGSGFSSAMWGTTPALFVPMSMKREITPAWDDLNDRRSQWLNIIGRLQPGTSRAQAEAATNALWYSIRSEEFKQLKTQTPRAKEGFLGRTKLFLFDGAKGFSALRISMKTPLLVIMGMVLLVLAMACVNTASLLLVRAAARVREFSMRYALGASRGRVLRQLLLEGLLLGVMGSLLGILLAPEVLKVLTTWISADRTQTPFSTSLDSNLLLFTAATTLLISVLFSLAPAAQFWKPNLLETLRTHGSTGSGGALTFRRTCVALQIGLSLLLLVGAGLFTRTIRNLRTSDVGMNLDHLVTFLINPQFSGYALDQQAPLRERLLQSLAAAPGVRGVAATSDPELANDGTSGNVSIVGYTAKEDEDMDAELPFISRGYFSTLGIPLLTGREFTAADTEKSQMTAIVNESFARHYFGSAQKAIGRYLDRRDEQKIAIVGVVKDSRHANPRDPVVRTVYRPVTQIGNNPSSPSGFAFYLRTAMPPQTMMNQIRQIIHNSDPKLVVDNLRTMDSQVERTLSSERVIAMLASSFAIIATLLAAIGLYGVLAYVTAQRTREVGIRMALGARPLAIAGLVLREVLVLTAASLLFAVPASLFLGRLIRSQLFNVSTTDTLTYIGAVAIVTVVAALAATLPAHRAATVDPMHALRVD
jgi:putative ABC transport system permease protein